MLYKITIIGVVSGAHNYVYYVYCTVSSVALLYACVMHMLYCCNIVLYNDNPHTHTHNIISILMLTCCSLINALLNLFLCISFNIHPSIHLLIVPFCPSVYSTLDHSVHPSIHSLSFHYLKK